MLAGRPYLRDERGFALPLALSILAIMGVLVAATVGFATHNTDRSIRDAHSSRALAAADAGVDAAVYRMNKAIVGSQVQGLLGVPAATVAELRCVTISAGQLSIATGSNGWCPQAGAEVVDGPTATGGSWVPAQFSYAFSTGLRVGLSPNQLIQRRVVSTGTAGDVTKRVMATVQLQIDGSNNLLSLFRQVAYRVCTPEPTSPTDPASGC